jgi:hypothetical protein
MLQFDGSIATNSNAVYPNVTASAGITSVLLDFVQTYDKSTKPGVIATLLNAVGPANPWLIFQIPGVSAPTASGQYNVNIWEYTSSLLDSTWGAQSTTWASTANIWTGAGDVVRTTLLSTDRAWISGSNEYSIKQYVLPENGGAYVTYNRPEAVIVSPLNTWTTQDTIWVQTPYSWNGLII